MDSQKKTTPSARLRTPQQNLEKLSFCSPKAEDITRWTEQLPVGDIDVLANTINQSLQEIIRLKTTPANRLKLLNAIEPQCHHVFLKTTQQIKLQPVTLSPEVKVLATLCQQIQMNLSQGYIAVAIQTKPSQLLSFRLSKQEPPETLVSDAIQSALLQLHYCQISAYQAGMAAPKSFWLKAHQLYNLAVQWGLPLSVPSKAQTTAIDTPSTSIQQLYFGILLLGTSQHYQLRAIDIPVLSSLLLLLGAQVELNEIEATQAVAVQQQQDAAPVFQPFMEKSDTKNSLYLHLDQVVQQLESSYRHSKPILVNDKEVPDYLIKHLILVWSSDIDRTFPRIERSQQIEITFGFSNIHYHISDGKPFSLYTGNHADLLLKKEQSKSLKKSDSQHSDLWNNPFRMHVDEDFDTNSFTTAVKANIKDTYSKLIHSEDEKHPIYTITTLDSSPGGYRAYWKGNAPSALKPGELIGYREGHHSRWGIAAIRWVRQQENGNTHFGIETLALSALPYAAIASTTLDTVLHRAFLLPEIQLLKQPPALITPQMTFKSKQRLFLFNHDGSHHTVMLKDKMDSTGSYQKFMVNFVQTSTENKRNTSTS